MTQPATGDEAGENEALLVRGFVGTTTVEAACEHYEGVALLERRLYGLANIRRRLALVVAPARQGRLVSVWVDSGGFALHTTYVSQG